MRELEIMTLVVALFGTTITVLGIFGLVRPGQLMRFVQTTWESSAGFYFAIGLRVVFGVVLLVAASESRFPQAFRILGIISLVAAGFAPFLGFARLQKFLQWWAARPPGLIRGWSLAAAAFGVFLVYGAW